MCKLVGREVRSHTALCPGCIRRGWDLLGMLGMPSHYRIAQQKQKENLSGVQGVWGSSLNVPRDFSCIVLTARSGQSTCSIQCEARRGASNEVPDWTKAVSRVGRRMGVRHMTGQVEGRRERREGGSLTFWARLQIKTTFRKFA